ncbi:MULTISPECIES: protein phosphatase 2C domain-containing protein [unclassified Streptomyces]|uniref:protein phosphatase 2C domain-containing protein n=1 Tax=unclassified Streptomyces TaxID=2593676 RepID=UPI0004C2769F|nr:MULTISPECIES: protein phosphatase 2C domain-containing protein [unclassified Streptomyces]
MGKHRQSPEEQWGPDRPVPPPPRPAPALYVPEPQEPLEPLEPLGQGGGQEPGPGEVYDWQREDWSETGAPAPSAHRTPGALVQASGHAAGGEASPGDRWRPLVVGTPGPLFAPRPPTGGLSYRPDTVCDGWSTDALDLRLASVRGHQHRYDGRPREDDAAAGWDPATGAVVFAVADGVSDARQPHIGSQLACRSAVDELLAQVRAGAGRATDWRKLLSTVHWQLLEQARRLLRAPDTGVEATADLLATTLVAGVATPGPGGVRVELVWVGDSGVWAIKHGELYPLAGGKRTGADGLLSSAVRPLPYLPAEIRPFAFELDPGTVLLIGTDGFGDPVGDGRGAVARLFADALVGPVPPLGFAHLLDFSRETFDDDRTLLALWPRSEVRECRG